VDVRVIAATNKDLEEEISKGNFREDLFYRLNVIPFYVPPLRERKEDIPMLSRHFLKEFSAAYSRRSREITDDAIDTLARYSWPGNVRELRNCLERAAIVCDGTVIERRHLPPGFGDQRSPRVVSEGDGIHVGVGTTVDEAERQLIVKTLESTHNNKTRAAEILGISLKTLHNKLKEYGQQGHPVSSGSVMEREASS
jgi:DNA-binding NtrC family response regulator